MPGSPGPWNPTENITPWILSKHHNYGGAK